MLARALILNRKYGNGKSTISRISSSVEEIGSLSAILYTFTPYFDLLINKIMRKLLLSLIIGMF